MNYPHDKVDQTDFIDLNSYTQNYFSKYANIVK